jgi:hypothetical protein
MPKFAYIKARNQKMREKIKAAQEKRKADIEALLKFRKNV